jgi:hypothetical protein
MRMIQVMRLVVVFLVHSGCQGVLRGSPGRSRRHRERFPSSRNALKKNLISARIERIRAVTNSHFALAALTFKSWKSPNGCYGIAPPICSNPIARDISNHAVRVVTNDVASR